MISDMEYAIDRTLEIVMDGHKTTWAATYSELNEQELAVSFLDRETHCCVGTIVFSDLSCVKMMTFFPGSRGESRVSRDDIVVSRSWEGLLSRDVPTFKARIEANL